jgi:hypothetical protein
MLKYYIRRLRSAQIEKIVIASNYFPNLFFDEKYFNYLFNVELYLTLKKTIKIKSPVMT